MLRMAMTFRPANQQAVENLLDARRMGTSAATILRGSRCHVESFCTRYRLTAPSPKHKLSRHGGLSCS